MAVPISVVTPYVSSPLPDGITRGNTSDLSALPWLHRGVPAVPITVQLSRWEGYVVELSYFSSMFLL